MSFLAAIKALQDGDEENFEVAIMPGGIERQEATGNRDFVANSTLPKCTGKDKEYLEQMGVVFGEDADDLFVSVQLPDGWSKGHAEDSRGSYLLDDKGNRRASIFYKAAFYDRYANISLTRRYSARTQPVGGYKGDHKSREWESIALDQGKEIWHSVRIRPKPEYSEDTRFEWLAWQDAKKALGGLAVEWLDKNKPDWRSPLAYWD